MMTVSNITMTNGKDWWLRRTTSAGRMRYPELIRVGRLEEPRVYVPERTCRPIGYRLDMDKDVIACTCSECGGLLVNFDFEQNPPKPTGYCPNCGARVVEP